MHWRSVIAASMLVVGSLAAKKDKSSAGAFETFHKKALSSTPVKLEDASYSKLTTAPRDYTAAVLLTAMDARYGCQLCREFQPEWDLLSRSWTKGDKAGLSRIVYATLDFSDGRDTFMALGLQTAPVLLLFQPTTGPHAVAKQDPIRYDFSSGPQTAEQVHSWISRHMADRPQPPVRRPINYVRWFATITMTLGAITVLFAAWEYIVPLVQNRNLWAGATFITLLILSSGQMFNNIRKVPYIAGDGKGGISYFASGFQNQYGMETQIVAALYGVLAFAVISLAIKAPRIADPNKQTTFVLVMSGVILVGYSFLLSVFRVKNGGYPFYLPPFF